MDQRNASIVSIIVAFAVGGLIGASAALLMAPMSGADTRHMIADKSMELKDRAVDTVGDTRDRASKVINDVTDKTKKQASYIGKRGKSRLNKIQDCL